MKQVNFYIEQFGQVLCTLEEVLRAPYSEIVKDATIQRFEYNYELFWKLLKSVLQEREGIDCFSPKSCIRKGLEVGLMNEEEALAFLQMVDDRNVTSHLYSSDVSEDVYKRIKDYYALMKNFFERLKIKG